MKKVLVLGAGLVSRPLVRYLLDQPGFRVTVASRTVSKAEALIAGHPGGKALPLLGSQPFYAVNGKIVWLNGKTDALVRLAEVWNDGDMDGLLLLQPTTSAIGYDGPGDFFIDQVAALGNVVISELKDHTYYARLRVRHDGELIEIDARPSDAIAVAVGRSPAIAACRNSAVEMSAADTPPQPFSSATICGIAVICTTRAAQVPTTAPTAIAIRISPWLWNPLPGTHRLPSVVNPATVMPSAASRLP